MQGMEEGEEMTMDVWKARTRYCAQCYAPMILKHIDGEIVLVCPNGCELGGHVSEEYIRMRQMEGEQEYRKVAANYPELVGKPKSKEEIKGDIRILYGEE